MPSTLTHLECSRSGCRHIVDCSPVRNLCTECGSPLLARYDLDKARKSLTHDALRARPHTMWRYDEVLPDARPVTLVGAAGRPRGNAAQRCLQSTKRPVVGNGGSGGTVTRQDMERGCELEVRIGDCNAMCASITASFKAGKGAQGCDELTATGWLYARETAS